MGYNRLPNWEKKGVYKKNKKLINKLGKNYLHIKKLKNRGMANFLALAWVYH